MKTFSKFFEDFQSDGPFELDPGHYFIGDPLYIFEPDEWDDLLNKTDNFSDCVVDHKGKKFVVFDTIYGDEDYEGSNGVTYTVNSGFIGCIPVDLISTPDAPISDVGSEEVFLHKFQCSTTDGVLSFGTINIDTALCEKPEEDEEDE